jgi:hypothetical protein
MSPPPFVVGVNLPWLSYGGDFGANAWHPRGGIARPEPRRRADETFAGLPTGPLHGAVVAARDPRGPRRRRRALGLDDFFFADVDAGFESAAARHPLIPVLIDSLVRPARWSTGS